MFKASTNVNDPGNLKQMPDNLLFFNRDAASHQEGLYIFHTILPQVTLNNIQEIVFLQSWEGKTYQSMAETYAYDADYLKDVGYKLWQMLSKEMGEPVNKNNFRSVFRQRLHDLEVSQSLESEPLSAQGKVDQSFVSSPLPSAMQTICDWGEAPDVPLFCGRVAELKTLEQWVGDEQCRLIGLYGIGGSGKTSLSIKLAELVKYQFSHLIWRSLRNQPDFGQLISEIIQFVAEDSVEIPHSTEAQISLLIQCLRQSRCLLILDDWNSLLRQHGTAGYYEPETEPYGQLLRRVGDSQHQSCLIFTSREKPIGVTFREGEYLPVRSLQIGDLNKAASQTLLKTLGLSATDFQIELLLKRCSGNPLALNAVVRTINNLFGGNVTAFLEQGTVIYGYTRLILDQQFARLSGTERRIMAHLATQDNWVSILELQQHLAPATSQEELLEALESLDRRSLILTGGGQFTQHPIIQKYTEVFHQQSHQTV